MTTIFIRRKPTTPPPALYIGRRVLHKVEGGYQKTPPGMPEVIPPENPLAVEMTEVIQWISYVLMRRFNPIITPAKWTKVHEHDIAFTNFNGFGNDGDPRANFITGENLNKGLPKYDKAQRLCGGSFVRGDVVADKLVCRAGLHGIDAGSLPRTWQDFEGADEQTKRAAMMEYVNEQVDQAIANQHYIYAVTIGDRDESKISHFPQGWDGADYYGPVVIPFIFNGVITFPLYVEIWTGDTLPDPLRIYRQ